MEKKEKRPKLVDVAELAGVSVSSVSRVLNSGASASEKLRERIDSAVKEVGYIARPGSSAAKSSVFVLVPDILNPYFWEITKGIEDQVNQHGWTLNIAIIKENDPRHTSRLLRALLRSPCRGVISTSSSGGFSDEELCLLKDKHKIPLVLINRKVDHPEIPSVGIDFENAMHTATRHLVDLGHNRIAYVGGYEVVESSVDKRRGFETSLRQYGLSPIPELCLTGTNSLEWGFHVMNKFLDLREEEQPTAVIASRDVLAFGVMHAIRLRKKSIPRDISIVGFDDILMAAHTNPPLTTISPPKYEMGRLAVNLLNQIISGSASTITRYTMLESPLVVRESTAACMRNA